MRTATILRCTTGLTFGLLMVIVAGNKADAQPAPLNGVEQGLIQISIDKGVEHLKRSQNGSGSWGDGTNVGAGGGHVVGVTALAAITLIECGVPITDAKIQKAAGVVRQGAPRADSPYEVGLAILLLDRVKGRDDSKLIQSLATRLIVGQSPSGGWSYKLPLINQGDTDTILSYLRKLNPLQSSAGLSLRDRPSSLGLCIKMSDDIRPRATGPTTSQPPEAVLKSLPATARRLPVFSDPDQLSWEDPKEKRSELFNGTTDNSNTHFAILGLWTARKHDVPTDRSFALLVRRFRTSQAANGLWAYDHVNGGGAGGTPSMTSVALLVLAIGHALGIEPDGAAARPEQDPMILNGLKGLSRFVGEPAGEMRNRPPVENSGGLYFFWAMERIAVLYDLRLLGNKDWYKWGAEILVSNQTADGSWAKGGYPGEKPVINTCFAVLFLKRANLLPDLARRFAVDSTALAGKPKVEVPPPVPFELPIVPLPSEQVTPEVATPQPTSEEGPRPAPAPPPAETTAAAPREERPIWPWLLGLLVLLIVAGIGLFFAMKSRKEEAEDDEKPRKKRKSRA